MSTPPITNPPGLAAIRYRIGTFTTFRQAMLDQIALPDLMSGAVTSLAQNLAPSDKNFSVLDASGFPATPPFRIRIGAEYLLVTASSGLNTWTVTRGPSSVAHQANDAVFLDPPNPFAGWQQGIDGDYQTLFVELWAYLGDVLTFYQERIANEAFLGTATQRDSLLRLTSLINYRPSPGAAAAGLIAFTAAKNTGVIVPAGFRVSSRAQGGQPSVVFETAASVEVVADNNAIPLALLSPQLPYPPGTIVLEGVNSRIAVNDLLLAVEREATPRETPHLLRVTAITSDTGANTTTIEWNAISSDYPQASKHVHIYTFAVHASPFGDTAPRWDTLPPGLTAPAGSAPFPVTWDSPLLPVHDAAGAVVSSSANAMFFVPLPNDRQDQLFLDSVYSQLQYSVSNPGWAVLLTDGEMFQTFHVVDARQTSKAAYALSAKSTRLTFVESVSGFLFPLRNTAVLTGTAQQPLQISLPLSDPLTGASLILSGIHPQLQDGQTAILRGNLFDPTANAATTLPAAESVILDGAPQLDPVNNNTVVNLRRPLANQYVRATCTLLANVVGITQGETIKDEILGSGDGTAFQTYALKKKPLTYLSSANPDGISAVDSTLLVVVDGVAWKEQPNLVGSAAHDQVYTTSEDDSGQTHVIFGDGYNGARPTSGVNNIHARYRKGLGRSGDLPADAVQQLVDNLTNLQKATNPVSTGGGDDPASPARIRTLAPVSLQTFGRAVSAQDYASLALGFPGIAKASAAWVLQDPVTLQAIQHPYVQLTAGTLDRVPLQGTVLAANLRRFLDTHRDPNVPLRIQDFTPVYIAVAVGIDIDPRRPHQATLNRVQAALNPGVNSDGSAGYFAYENLTFGQPIYLSSLYAIVQGIEGVLDATITVLRRVGPGFSDPVSQPPHDILISPTEIVTIDSTANRESTLTVTGQGGFADV